jgi:L-lactate dehydrogenase (cytochrome)
MARSTSQFCTRNNALSRQSSVTAFVPHHPGGPQVVLSHAGKDATAVYKPIHPPNAISDNLTPEQHMGTLDPATVPQEDSGPTEADLVQQRRSELPHVQSMVNLDDFERAAEHVLGSGSQAFAYYRSAADDEVAFERNRRAFSFLNFLPRVLVPVQDVSTSTSFLGVPVHIRPLEQIVSSL